MEHMGENKVPENFSMMQQTIVIFGGSGFIGSHLAAVLLQQGAGIIYVVDIKPPPGAGYSNEFTPTVSANQVKYINVDVRQPIEYPDLPCKVDLIVNLAAIHREPGHEPHEYFETNIPGAENVCAWAEKIGCEHIVFTSSIAPYGPCETPKSEASIPCPETAYGSSKLVAEKIHLAWQGADTARRKLVIVRPGVVFGPGEGGNVTRLVRAVLGRYFFYMGNRQTIKAGIYVKELCHSILWALDKVDHSGTGWLLYNATMNPAPAVEDYVTTICKVAGVKRACPGVPYALLYVVAGMLEIGARPLGVKHPFSPVRIRKLVRSNNIQAEVLRERGYEYRYTLKTALEDWKHDFPQDWNE
jgi:nucleoside-diphosphate-sugar epimerase